MGWPITPGFEFSGKIVAFGPKKLEESAQSTEKLEAPKIETLNPVPTNFEVNSRYTLLLTNSFRLDPKFSE